MQNRDKIRVSSGNRPLAKPSIFARIEFLGPTRSADAIEFLGLTGPIDLEHADVQPLTRVARLSLGKGFTASMEAVDKKIGWHRLPMPLSILILIGDPKPASGQEPLRPAR